MDGDVSNDFTRPDGTILSQNATDREIFTDFGSTWATTAANSVFFYPTGSSHSTYVNSDFVPAFLSDGIVFSDPNLERQAALKCNNNRQCMFDISVTGDVSMGNLVLNFETNMAQFKSIIDNIGKPIRIDDPIPNPVNPIQSSAAKCILLAPKLSAFFISLYFFFV